MRYRGGVSREEVRRAERADAKGEIRRSGRRRRPAWVGVRRKVDWKRWGRVTTREVKGIPVRNALLLPYRHQPFYSQSPSSVRGKKDWGRKGRE